MKTKQPNTALAGAQAERDATLSKAKREQKLEERTGRPHTAWYAWEKLRQWCLSRKKRYDARPGGLGRGKK